MSGSRPAWFWMRRTGSDGVETIDSERHEGTGHRPARRCSPRFGAAVSTGGQGGPDRLAPSMSHTDQKNLLRPVVVVRVAGVRLRTPVPGPSRRGPKTDPSHPETDSQG